MTDRLLSDELTEQIIQYTRNSLQAHDSDLADELKSSIKRRVSIVFVLTLEAVGTDIMPKMRVRIPRQALAVETMFGKQRNFGF